MRILRCAQLFVAIGAFAHKGSHLVFGNLLAAALAWTAPLQAQISSSGPPLAVADQQALRGALNRETLMVATSPSQASYLGMAQDMAAALRGDAGVRLVALTSGGGAANLRDLMFLRGVDFAIVPANLLVQTKFLERQLGAGLRKRLGYVTQLYPEEVHLLVGAGVGDLGALKGGRIAVPLGDGTAEFTARDLIERLSINAEVVGLQPVAAVERVRSGEVAAALFIGGKPLGHVSQLPKDGRLRLMGLPYAKALEAGYLPATLRANDYPTLVPPGSVVDTVAVSAVLMANIGRGHEESARRVARFIPAFFSAIADLSLLGGAAKWSEMNLAAPLPGWTRVAAAEDWLDEAREQQRAVLLQGFEEFLRARRQPGAPALTAAERMKLFDTFVQWTRQSVGAPLEAARP